MRIQYARTVHIHLPAAAAPPQEILGAALNGGAFAPAVHTTRTIPAIGAPWPGVDGIYAGIARGEDGQPDAHLVELNATPGRRMPHAEAMAWIKALGDGAHAPSRIEGALLAANLREENLAEKWIWLEPQYSASYAWYQFFFSGNQDGSNVSAEGGVRAVRRFPL